MNDQLKALRAEYIRLDIRRDQTRRIMVDCGTATDALSEAMGALSAQIAALEAAETPAPAPLPDAPTPPPVEPPAVEEPAQPGEPPPADAPTAPLTEPTTPAAASREHVAATIAAGNGHAEGVLR